jgi:hypothetical protein
MKLKLTDVILLKIIFESLCEQKVRIGESEKTIPFAFSAKTRWAIAKNLRICQDAFDLWHREIVEPLKKSETFKQLNGEEQFLWLNNSALREAEQIEDFYKFNILDFSDVVNDKNVISPATLSVLDKFSLISEN